MTKEWYPEFIANAFSQWEENNPIEKWAEDLSGTLQKWKLDWLVNMKSRCSAFLLDGEINETTMRYDSTPNRWAKMKSLTISSVGGAVEQVE